MKHILVDYTYYQHGAFHGGGEYGDTIIRRLLCEKNAHTFVFPSFNEGFGYPPLEAMHYHVPCLCSASTSLCEILGEMAIYFNPLFVGEIENRILQSFSDEIRDEYKRKIDLNIGKITQRQKDDLEKLVAIITS